MGILIADLAKVEAARRRDVGGGLDRIREKRKAPLHLRRRFQRAVHEALALEAQCINRRLLADRAQHVLQRSPFRSMIENVAHRSEEHTSELQSLMSISYAVFFLKKK